MKQSDLFLTGLSCRLPESDTPYDFFQNLLAKKDMVTGGSKRWVKTEGIPERFGKIKQDLGCFDSHFFAIHGAQGEKLDPQIRLLLEVSYEALVDAGLSLKDIKGSKTGVYIGSCSADAIKAWGNKMESMTGYELSGCASTMLSNRLSFFYDLHGPSETIDTACSSSLVAFHRAVTDLESGVCDYAIVGGASVLLWPSMSYGFSKMKMLSPDGACKTFDQSANGFARSEGIVVFILTNKKNIKCIPYAKILGTAVNSGGWNSSGITVPNSEAQKELYRDVCKKAGIKPKEIDYIEAHGTGTVVGDGEELAAIYDVYGKENPNLIIGSVKSNMGHCEGAAGLAGILKTLLCFEQEVLAPNLHLINPNPKLNNMRVITDSLPEWKAVKATISSFGFGGTNAHVILEKHSDSLLAPQTFPNALGITLLAHRTKEGLYELKKALTTSQLTFEVPNRENKQKLPFREVLGLADDLDITSVASSPDKIYFACSGNGSQWKGMGLSLYQELPLFKHTIDRASKAIEMDLHSILSNGFSNACEITTALVAVQIGLIELLKHFGIQEDQIGGFFGHSAGEIVCSYLDGLTDLETTMKIAHTRGWVADQTGDQGAMAVIGLSKDKVLEIIKKNKQEDSVVVACVNSPNNVTISGHKADVIAILDELAPKEIFCRLLDTLGKAYHSPLFSNYKTHLEEKLSHNLNGKIGLRSAKWFTSILDQKSDVFDFQYHVNGVLRPVNFVQTFANIPQDSIILEIGPHSILKSLIRDNRPDLKYASLMKKEANDFASFKEGIGQLWKLGIDLKLPSSQSLPIKRLPLEMRSKLVSWNHTNLLPVPSEKDFKGGSGEDHTVIYNLSQEKNRYLSGHVVGGKCILPATSYLCAMWEAFRKHRNLQLTDSITYSFDQFEIIQAVQVDKDSNIELTVSHLGNQYEVLFKQDVIARAKIDLLPDKNWKTTSFADNEAVLHGHIDENNFYRIIGSWGYNYLDEFRVIDKITCNYQNNATYGRLKWDHQNWVTLLDGILQTQLIHPRKWVKELRVPVRVRSIFINPQLTCQSVPGTLLPVEVQFDQNCARAPGVEIRGIEAKELGTELAKESKVDCKQEHSVVYFGRNTIKDRFTDDYFRFATNYAVHLCSQVIEEEKLSQVGHYKRILDSFKRWGKLTAVDQEKLNFYRNHPSRISIRMLEYFYHNHRQEFIQNPLMAINQYPEHDKYYAEEPVSSLHDTDALGKLVSVVRENSPSRILNILEIGTGTGGLTRLIAPHVINDKYVVTDITATSQIAIDSRVEQLDFVYETFDLNKKDHFQLLTKHNTDLVLASNSLHTANNIETTLENIFSNLKEGSFIIFCENSGPGGLTLWGMDSRLWSFEDEREYGLWMSQERWLKTLKKVGFELISYFADDNNEATLFCVRKPIQIKLQWISAPSIDHFDEWKSQILNCEKPTLLVADSLEKSGVIGFTRCLNKEVDHKNFYSLLTDTPFNPAILSEIERYGLRTNILRQGKLGAPCAGNIEYHRDSTYEMNGFYLDFARRGDLSSYRWINNSVPCSSRMTVKFAALNFKDVMLATAKITKEAFCGIFKDGYIGTEFSGVDDRGNRFMGITNKAIATQVDIEEYATCPIPPHITDEEAATIPVVYTTAYYALYNRANIKPGQSILIHAGTGGVGQAAIHICLSLGCKIFVTCHPGKNKIIKELFPALEDAFILDSRTTQFEEAIMEHTKGQGVNIVLNSLAEEKLQASLRCVAMGGHFLEIGKYDLMKHSSLDMKFLLPNTTVHGINLEQILAQKDETRRLLAQVERGLYEGIVKPLPRHVFNYTEAEEAFRFLASGKHIGKVLIKMEGVSQEFVQRLPLRFSQDEQDSGYYLVTGGLGGFGLALLTWLVDRGVRKFLVTSRRGISSGEQHWILNVLRSRGAEIIVSTKDASNEQEVNELIASVKGNIRAVFHLGMVLEDGLLKNMSKEKWDTVVQIKAKGAIYLDRATRLPSVKHFMAFSSVTNTRGNIGQTNYAFGNSVLEEVCRLRAEAGHHALAVQWGLIGDVGFVANSAFTRSDLKEIFATTESFGTIPIHEALDFINDLLVNQINGHCVYYSADLVKSSKDRANKLTTKEVISQMGKVMKLDLHASNGKDTLKDLGVDSLQLVEIQTILLKALQEVVSLKKISSTTVADLIKMIDAKLSQGFENQRVTEEVSTNAQAISVIEPIHTEETNGVVYLFLGLGVDYKTLHFPKINQMSLKTICWEEIDSIDEVTTQIQSDIQKNQYKKVMFLTHSGGYHIAKCILAKHVFKIDKFVAIALVQENILEGLAAAETLNNVSDEVYTKEYQKIAAYVENHLPIGKIRKQSMWLAKTALLNNLPPHLILRPREDALSKTTAETIEIRGNHHIESLDMNEIYAYLE